LLFVLVIFFLSIQSRVSSETDANTISERQVVMYMYIQGVV